eukprot:6409429-Ditylum_brightwellii.AAC.1
MRPLHSAHMHPKIKVEETTKESLEACTCMWSKKSSQDRQEMQLLSLCITLSFFEVPNGSGEESVC